MAEYKRDKHHQYCDTELCMVMDTVTGDKYRFAKDRKNNHTIGTVEQALDFVSNMTGWQDRTIIIKMQCIKPFRWGT